LALELLQNFLELLFLFLLVTAEDETEDEAHDEDDGDESHIENSEFAYLVAF
jgi:hypothetical protein